jgi:quercetin dioxygenase-like cupin family protein
MAQVSPGLRDEDINRPVQKPVFIAAAGLFEKLETHRNCTRKKTMKKFVLAACLTFLLSGTSWALHDNSVTVDVLARSASSWNGEILPSYSTGQPEVTILRISIPPHVQLPLHQHPVINAGVLLKGTLTVLTREGRTLHLAAGDPIVEVVNTWHYGINEGDEPAEIIVFYAGIQGKPVTVKDKE